MKHRIEIDELCTHVRLPDMGEEFNPVGIVAAQV